MNKETQAMSYEDAIQVINEAREYNLETYSDCAEICCVMRNYIDAAKVVDKVDNNMDEVEKKNLEELRSLMDRAAQLWLTCDPYYRSR